jgi:hypothetical protein
MHCFLERVVINKILSEPKSSLTPPNCHKNGTIQKMFGFSEDFGSDSILFLTILSLKQCMYIEVRLHVCGDSRCENLNSLWWLVLLLVSGDRG